MSRIAYLGATQNQTHLPGQLVISTPLDKLTEGELDLLLAKQRLEIDKQNSATVGGPFNFQQDNYQEAIKVISACIANINNPDHICAIGENIEAIGKKKNGKTAAGRLLQKSASTIKKGVKAVKNVATAPLKLIAKGAMEIYLPKAAPFFLYLFAAENILPDAMKAKRKKAAKFKKFVVDGLGMQDKHFTAIIRNRLTSLLKMSPESFLAEKLKARVSGIAGIGKTNKRQLRKANGGKVPKLKTIKVTAPNGQIKQRTAPNVNMDAAVIVNPVKPKKSFPTFDGNLLAFAVQALMFLVSKIGGKNNPGKITTADFPNVEADAANAFEYKDLTEDYSQLNDRQKESVRDVATDLIEKNAGDSTIEKVLNAVTPFLNVKQKEEIKYEVKEGFEALDDDEAFDLSRKVKMNVVDTTREGDTKKFEDTGGGTGAGVCGC
jgi:hypothetical protein